MNIMCKTLVLLLLFWAYPIAAFSEKGQKADPVSGHLYGMIEDFANSSAKNNWLKMNSDILSVELANQAFELMKGAIRDDQRDQAINAGLLSSAIYGAKGNYSEEFKVLLIVSDVSFNWANSVLQYERAKEHALTILNRTQSREFKNLTFQATVIAADCEFYSLLVGDNFSASKTLVLMEHLVDASQLINQVKEEKWVERYLSLVVGTYEQIRHRIYANDTNEQLDSMFGKIVAKIENLGKIEYRSMTEKIDLDKKTLRITSFLGELSYRYGNPNLGNQRFSFVEEKLWKLKDVETWIEIVYDHYNAERSYRNSPQHFVKLREMLRGKMDDLRDGFRSRVGRIWAGSKLELMKGIFLKHEMMERKEEIDELVPLINILHLNSLFNNVDFVVLKSDEEVFREFESFKAATLREEMAGLYTSGKNPGWAKQVRGFEQRVFAFGQSQATVKSDIEQEMLTVSKISFDPNSSSDRLKALQGIEKISTLTGLGFAKSLHAPNLKKVMDSLLPNEAIIEYFIPHDPLNPSPSLFIFLITSDKATAIFISLDELFKKGILESETGLVGRISIDGKPWMDITPLSELIVYLRYALRTKDDIFARRQLRILHQLLIKPIIGAGIDFGHYQHLIIAPHGMLHFVPFAALVDDNGRFLIENVAISIVPSASTWLETIRGRNSPSVSFVGFGDVTLPKSEKEILKIVGSLKGVEESHYTTNKTATEANFKKSVKGKTIIHVAAHGNFPAEDALFSQSIILGKDQNDDGTLEAEEIKNLDLRSASLVVLSICNGALYRIGPADEPFGLVRALFVAGVQNIMGTLWPLEEEFSFSFMGEFYKHLIPHGPATAFQKAAKVFIDEGELIWRWAGFTIVGPGRAFREIKQ